MVTQACRTEGERRRVLANEIDAVASPLIRQRQRARCGNSEAGWLAHGHGRVLRLRRDGRRNALGELNLVNRAIDVTVQTALEVIKRAVARDLQIYGKVGERREKLRSRGGGIECSDPADTKIRVEIFTAIRRWKLQSRRIVKSSGSDRTTHIIAVETVTVGVKRTLKPRIVRYAFSCRPTVIRAGDTSIQLFPGLLTDVIDEHPHAVGFGECKAVRIAQPERPNRTVLARRRQEKRIVARNRSVAVDAQDLAKQSRERL